VQTFDVPASLAPSSLQLLHKDSTAFAIYLAPAAPLVFSAGISGSISFDLAFFYYYFS